MRTGKKGWEEREKSVISIARNGIISGIIRSKRVQYPGFAPIYPLLTIAPSGSNADLFPRSSSGGEHSAPRLNPAREGGEEPTEEEELEECGGGRGTRGGRGGGGRVDEDEEVDDDWVTTPGTGDIGAEEEEEEEEEEAGGREEEAESECCLGWED